MPIGDTTHSPNWSTSNSVSLQETKIKGLARNSLCSNLNQEDRIGGVINY